MRWMLAVTVSGTTLAWAGEWSGYAGLEGRVFAESSLYAEQSDAPGLLAVLQPKYEDEWQEGDLSLTFQPHLRWDSMDTERSAMDLRALSLLWIRGDWEYTIGVSKVFWGVAESQHLVDVVNQSDVAANPDGEEKLGQAMAQITRVSGLGDFSLLVLPGFRERTYPGREGRLRPGLWVDGDLATYEASAGAGRLDWAVRWFRTAGDFDVGLHYFDGTGREPELQPWENGAGEMVLAPRYRLTRQLGLDAQLTRGGWLWKIEALGREYSDERYAAMVGGFEYTVYGLGGSSLDLGILAEAHLDGRGRAAPTFLNRDLFVGGRLTWNDEADSALLAGGFVDAETGATMLRAEYERRLGDRYKLEVEVQAMANLDGRDGLYPLRRDGYAQVGLSWYF